MTTNLVLSNIDFDKFRNSIESRSGIYIDDSRHRSFKISLDTRMNALGIHDYGSYHSFIMHDDAGRKEFEELFNLILIKETFFFRDERQLKILRQYVLPELLERKKSQEVRIWSAGCATGEEPYSIAMAIMEDFFPAGMNVSISGTDISDTALKMAKEGVYTKSSMRAIDTLVLKKYFTQKDGQYFLGEQVKQRVRFNLLNLIEPYFLFEKNSIDVVFCKNVIIYFRLETVKTIIRRLYDMLTEGGYLFLGHSESLWQISDDFKLEEVGGVFFYRKNGKGAVISLSDKPQQKEKRHEAINRERFVRTEAAPLQILQKIDMDSVPVRRERKENVSTRGSDQNKKTDISKWLTEKAQLSGNNDFDAVLDEIEGVINEYPGNVDTHLLAGRMYADMGLYDKALRKGLDVLKIDDFSAGAYVLIGSIYYKIGDSEKAVISFKKAIYLDEKPALPHYYLGNLYKDSHLVDQAVKEYKNVIQIITMHSGNGLLTIGGVFTGKQLKEICSRNIEILTAKNTR